MKKIKQFKVIDFFKLRLYNKNERSKKDRKAREIYKEKEKNTIIEGMKNKIIEGMKNTIIEGMANTIIEGMKNTIIEGMKSEATIMKAKKNYTLKNPKIS